MCLKKGGHICYALNGLNRYHAILGGGPSFIVHPSNLAPALIAFGASVQLSGPGGERKVVLDQFFALPSVDATRENVLQAGEIVIEVIVPPPAASTQSAYLEVREKQSFDWPLVSVAAVLEIDPRSKKIIFRQTSCSARWRRYRGERARRSRRSRAVCSIGLARRARPTRRSRTRVRCPITHIRSRSLAR